jgi:chromosome partitioning protein
LTTIIAINNHKGGVAKTTTCLSLGACLAEQGRTVLLVDLDPQAHLTMSLGVAPEELRRTVADALLANSSLVGVSRESAIPGLDLVPANRGLATVDKLLYPQKGYEFNLKQRLAGLNGHGYDFVLLDCAPSFGVLTLNALAAAHLLLIPVQAEYYAAHSLRPTIELANLARAKTNPGLRTRLVVTMYDQRNRISRAILAQLQQELSRLLFNTVIGIDVRLKECPAFGRPITRYAPAARSAQQYRALARELVNSLDTYER